MLMRSDHILKKAADKGVDINSDEMFFNLKIN